MLNFRLNCFAVFYAGILFSLILNLQGCRILGDFENDKIFIKSGSGNGGSISGQITASDAISVSIRPLRNSLIQADVKVSNAEVWLQDDPDVTAKTNSDGYYNLLNVSFGSHRVVAKFYSQSQDTTYKIRSREIIVASESANQEIGALAIEPAKNNVQGILLDSAGNPVPNAELWLWGERFYTDQNGRYTSPPLPDKENIEEIKVVKAAGFEATSIITQFTAGGESVNVTTLSKPGESNHPPKVLITTAKTHQDKIQPGEKVVFWAVYYDPNKNDFGKLKERWRVAGGALASSTVAMPEDLKRRVREFAGYVDLDSVTFSAIEWTVPTEKGNYKIEIEVFDPGGFSGKAQYPINIGNADAVNHPPTAEIIGSNTIYAGNYLDLRVVATDRDLDVLVYNWSAVPSVGSFSSITAMNTTWKTPNSAGSYEIRCKVQEIRGNGEFVIATLSVQVYPSIEVSKGRITGHVIDELTNLPITGAIVGIVGTSLYTITDANGYFEFSRLAPGVYDLAASRDGYKGRTFLNIAVP